MYQAWNTSISGSGRVDFSKTNGKAKISQAITGVIVPQTQNIETRNISGHGATLELDLEMKLNPE